jgi:hypothetical protein
MITIVQLSQEMFSRVLKKLQTFVKFTFLLLLSIYLIIKIPFNWYYVLIVIAPANLESNNTVQSVNSFMFYSFR